MAAGATPAHAAGLHGQPAMIDLLDGPLAPTPAQHHQQPHPQQQQQPWMSEVLSLRLSSQAGAGGGGGGGAAGSHRQGGSGVVPHNSSARARLLTGRHSTARGRGVCPQRPAL
jgi:hypothetical protein